MFLKRRKPGLRVGQWLKLLVSFVIYSSHMLSESHRKAKGLRLKSSRLSAGLSQSDAAEHAQVTRQTVSDWEAGNTRIAADHLSVIAMAYGATMDSLVFGMPTVPVRNPEGCQGCENFTGVCRANALDWRP